MILTSEKLGVEVEGSTTRGHRRPGRDDMRFDTLLDDGRQALLYKYVVKNDGGTPPDTPVTFMPEADLCLIPGQTARACRHQSR